MTTLITTAKMNDADPEAWPADVLARIAEHPTSRLDDLLPWNWGPREARALQAALILAAITHVFIITYVAEMLGEDEDWLANYRSTCSQSTVACMSTAARMMRMMR